MRSLIQNISFPSLKLRGRLMTGFLLCAVLAAVSGGVGLLSIQQIARNVRSTAGGIGELIDQQDVQARESDRFESLVTRITGAQSAAAIASLEAELRELRQNATGPLAKDAKTWEAVDRLLGRRREELRAQDELVGLSHDSESLVDRITKVAADVAAAAQTGAVAGIEQTTAEIRVAVRETGEGLDADLATLSDQTATALSTVKTALDVRLRAHDLNVQIKNALLAEDPAIIAYAEKTLAGVLDNARQSLGSLPKGDSTIELAESLDLTSKLIADTIEEKEQLLTSKRQEGEIQKDLDAAVAAVAKTLSVVDRTSLEMADSIEFDATLAIEDTVSKLHRTLTEDTVGSLGGVSDLDDLEEPDESEASEASRDLAKSEQIDSFPKVTIGALASLQTALTAKNRGHEVNGQVHTALTTEDIAVVQYAGAVTETLRQNARQDVANLPPTGASEGLTEAFDDLFEAVNRVFDTKMRLLVQKKRTRQTAEQLQASVESIEKVLGSIDESALAIVDTIEFDATLAVDDTATGIKERTQQRGSDNLDKLEALSTSTSSGVSEIKAALDVRVYCHQFAPLLKDALDVEQLAVLEDSRAGLLSLVGTAREAIGALPESEQTVSADRQLTSLGGVLGKMLDARRQVVTAQRDVRQTSTQVAAQMADLREAMLAAGQHLKTSADNTLLSTNRSVGRWQTVQWTLAMGAVLLALAVGLLVSNSITRPLGRTLRLLRDIAEGEGDLTKRLRSTSRDELGELATLFDTFVEKLHGIIKELVASARGLTKASSQLSTTAVDLAGGADHTTIQSASVRAAAEEMATNMEHTSQSNEQVTENIRGVASSVEGMTSRISEIARSTEQASKVATNAAALAQSSNENINDLSNAAHEIGKVIQTIQDVSEQTNLLALNATIEAARAGEAGKGFAVVATEVKELARQTANATQDIREQIEGVQKSSGEAVRSLGEINSVIDQISDVSRMIATAVEEQSETTREIADSITASSEAAEVVAVGVTQAASASKGITENIASVDQAAKQAAQGAAQTQTSGRELAKLAETVESLLEQFKV